MANEEPPLGSQLPLGNRGGCGNVREVINLRFELRGGRDYNMQEISRIFKLTRECIRQIEMQALNRIRQSTGSARLVGFLD